MTLMGFIVRMQNNKIDKSMSKELADERHEEIERRLGRGVERFDKIDGKLDAQKEILIEVSTIVRALGRKNGVTE